MEWLSYPPPVWLQWVIGIIGVVAFVMAVQPFTQMIWGRPKITVDFDVLEVEGGRVLECLIHNYPITRGLLHLLGVRRMPAEDIMAHFSIKEHSSHRVVFEVVPNIISYTGTTGAQRISLAASPFPAKFGMVVVSDAESKAKVYGNSMILPTGLYCAFVEIIVEGKPLRAERNFAVIDKYPFAYWDVNS